MAGVVGIRPLGGLDIDFDGLVTNPDRTQLPVDGAHHGTHAALVGVADGRQPEDQADSPADLRDMLLTRLQPVEKVQGVEPPDIAVRRPGRQALLGRPRKQQPIQRGLAYLTLVIKISRVFRGESAIADRYRTPLQGLGPERLGPATWRIAQLPVEETDHRVRNVVLLRVLSEVIWIGANRNQMQRKITNSLRRGRDLGWPAQNAVRRGVHRLDLLKFLAQPQRNRLLAEIRALTAWDLVIVNPAGRAR